MSESHKDKEFHDACEDVAQLIMRYWLNSEPLASWIFIGIDKDGHPSTMSSIENAKVVHEALLKLGQWGMSNLKSTDEVKLETEH